MMIIYIKLPVITALFEFKIWKCNLSLENCIIILLKCALLSNIYFVGLPMSCITGSNRLRYSHLFVDTELGILLPILLHQKNLLQDLVNYVRKELRN